MTTTLAEIDRWDPETLDQHLVGEKPDGFDDLFENKAGPGSRAVVPQSRVDGTDSGSASNPPQTVIVR